MVLEHHPHRQHHLAHVRVIERPCLEHCGEARCPEQVVSFAQWDLECFRELQDHASARMGAAGFEVTQVTL
jgi:hypothetical protein